MNVNEYASVFGRGRGKGRQLKVVPIQRTLMGPPIRPPPKRKESSTPAHTTSSSSKVNWKLNQKSTQNNSTTVRTSTSSRSHSSTEPESRVVIALSEGRGEAVGEVGIAAINLARPSLILCQISDSQSYIKTLTKINILNPSEILIPLTFIESFTSNRLINKVKEQFRDVKITGVTRSTFNKSTGFQYVKQLCVPSMNAILLILHHRYYALAAAAALLTYAETTLYVHYARESIKIEYQESEDSTIIDVATADRLELVASARPTMKKRFSCLLDVLNHCLTKIGSRTLRASILQPPCSVPDIEARLDCVTELVEHADMLAAIQVVLSKLTNIDQLLTLATILPDQAQSCSERQINYILLLNTVLEQIAPLQDIFENSTQPFFVEVRATASNPAFTEIKDLVRILIHTEAHPGKGQYGMFQRCFAIKSGINSLLDLVRKSYSERLDDMRQYVTSLGERYSLALTLHNNHKKGYHILLNLNAHQKKTLKKDDLPPECIQVERLQNSYTMKTQDLINLSNRIEDIMSEILKMSNIMIHKLLIQIREHIGIFYKLCEDVAKLDMLQSLAQASSAMHYVRPQFADYLEVKQARHPLLDFLCTTEPSANSMGASKEYNLNIITGPNGSGKSILVRQVILIQVMAQVGCYVPAQSATLRVSDRILARVYLEDNMDCGASAFVLEMKEIQYFLTVLTNNTLIIIDELCRSTSVEEGTAIAMAVCEKLMKTSAFLFFTTHFKFLTKLEDIHFGVKTWQLETLRETINDQTVLRFTYNVIGGVTSLDHYGIFLAKGSWPKNIIKYAEEILGELSRSKRPSPFIKRASVAARLKYDLEADLRMLKAKRELTRIRINEKLIEYQRELEGLGHHVEILLLSDRISDDNRLSLFGNDDNNCGMVQNGVVQTYYPLNQTGEFVDYLNLQRRSQCSDINDVSQDINQAMANLRDENREIPQLFNFRSGSRDMEDSNQERLSNSFYPENVRLRFSPPTRPCNRKTYFQSNHNYQSPFAAVQEEYYESFSDIVGLNNSAMSERIARLPAAEMNESLNFSYPNIFEPEVILETNTELELSSASAQPKGFVFQQKSTFVTQENIFMTSHHGSFSFPHASNENSVLSRECFISREGSVVSRENSIISRRNSIVSNASIYEDAVSEYFGSENGFEDYLEPINVNGSRSNDGSFLSITEQQFSLPLQQHVERTSTPITSRSQPQPLWNQTGANLTNPPAPKSNKLNRPNWEQSNFKTSNVAKQPFGGVNWRDADQVNKTPHGVFAPSGNTKKWGTNETQPKSDTTKSDSIKWVAPNQNIFTTPTIFTTPKSNQSSSNGAKIILNQASSQTATSVQSVDNAKQRNTSSNITNSKTSAESMIWNLETKNTCDIQKNAHNVSNSRYYSEADITEVLNDLQSCSEYFSDSQDWDFVDEEVNSKLNQQKLDKTINATSDNCTEVLAKGPNFQNHETDKEVNPKFDLQMKNRNQPESGKNLDPRSNKSGKKIIAPKKYHKDVSQKQDQGDDNKEMAMESGKNLDLHGNKFDKQIIAPMKYYKDVSQKQDQGDDNQEMAMESGKNLDLHGNKFGKQIIAPKKYYKDVPQKQDQGDDNQEMAMESGKNLDLHGNKFGKKIIAPKIHYKDVFQKQEQGNDNQEMAIESGKNLDPHGNKFGKQIIAPKIYSKAVSQKQDQGDGNQETTYPQGKSHIQSKSIENPHRLHQETKEAQFDIEIHEPPHREATHQLEHNQRTSQFQSFPKIQKLKRHDEFHQFGIEIHEAPSREGTHQLQHNQRSSQFQGFPKIQKQNHNDELRQFGTEIHEAPSREGTHHLEHNQRTSQFQGFAKIQKQNHNDELHQFGTEIHEAPSREGTHQLQHNQRSSQFQGFPKIQKQNHNDELRQFGTEIHEAPSREGTHHLEHNQRTSQFQGFAKIQKQNHNDELHQFGTEIHEAPSREGIHQLQHNQRSSQLQSFPKIQKLNHNDELHRFGTELHEAPSLEGTLQLEHNQRTSQLQSFPKIQKLNHNDELRQFGTEVHEAPSREGTLQLEHTERASQPQIFHSKEPYQLKFNQEIDQIKSQSQSNKKTHQSQSGNEIIRSQCNEESSQPQQEPTPSQTSQKSEHGPQNNYENINLGHNKSAERLENAGNEIADPNLTFSPGSKTTPGFGQKSSNTSGFKILSPENTHSYEQSQSQRIKPEKSNNQTERHHKNDVECVPSQPNSLEPLGDIHLELFSDESIFDESQTQTKEDNCPLNKKDPLANENSKEILPLDSGNPKLPLDCNNAVPGPSKLTLKPQTNLNTTDDYETAHGDIEASSQNSIFFNTPCSIEPLFTSTPYNEKRQLELSSQTDPNLPQTSKRKRLGYVTPNLNKPNLSPIPKKTTFNKESSPDIFESSQQEIYPLFKEASGETSKTPSDFESSKNTAKRPKWVPPLKTNQEQKKAAKKTVRRSKIPKFTPPRKLTKKEIELAFYEQDKKMMESGDSSQYLEQIINRPTVRQLQQAEHLVSVRKTSSGVVVRPAEECKPRKRKFVPPLKNKSGNFDVTLFSDKNSTKFEQFLNNNGKKVVNVRQDIANQFIQSEVVSKENVGACNKSSEGNSSGKACKDVQKSKVKILQNISLVPTANLAQMSEIGKRPKEGYYTQNKKRIDSIVDKYLMPEIEGATAVNVAVTSNKYRKYSQEFNSSFFSQSTVALDVD